MAHESSCQCGRKWSDCVFTVQRSGLNRYTYYRCPTCLTEWTIPEVVDSLSDPISSGEILEVHRLLQGDPTIGELTH